MINDNDYSNPYNKSNYNKNQKNNKNNTTAYVYDNKSINNRNY